MAPDLLDKRYSRLLQLLQAAILGSLSNRNTSAIGDVRNICDPLLEDYVEDQDLNLAISGLVASGYLVVLDASEILGTEDAGYGLTSKGLEYLRSKVSQRDNYLYYFMKHGDSWLTAELESAYQDLDVLEPIRRFENATIESKRHRKELDEIADALARLSRA